MMPVMPAVRPQSANAAILIRLRLTPARLAASALPPIAYTYRPNLVRLSSTVHSDEQHQDDQHHPRHAADDREADAAVGVAYQHHQDAGHRHGGDLEERDRYAAAPRDC